MIIYKNVVQKSPHRKLIQRTHYIIATVLVMVLLPSLPTTIPSLLQLILNAKRLHPPKTPQTLLQPKKKTQTPTEERGAGGGEEADWGLGEIGM